jgi:hypothetical protein
VVLHAESFQTQDISVCTLYSVSLYSVTYTYGIWMEYERWVRRDRWRVMQGDWVLGAGVGVM